MGAQILHKFFSKLPAPKISHVIPFRWITHLALLVIVQDYINFIFQGLGYIGEQSTVIFIRKSTFFTINFQIKLFKRYHQSILIVSLHAKVIKL